MSELTFDELGIAHLPPDEQAAFLEGLAKAFVTSFEETANRLTHPDITPNQEEIS